MEVTASSILLSFALATFVTCAWKAVNWVWLRPKQLERCLRDQGFKGNPYRFLYGDSKEFGTAIIAARSKPMDANDDDIVPRVGPFHQYFVNLHGILAYEGEKWATHRSLVNPAFHLEKLKLMVPAMYSSCCEMISKWEVLVSTKGSCELDVWPYLFTLTADVISRTAFGSDYEEGKQIFQLQREQTDLLMQRLQSMYIPGWRFLPTKTNRKMRKIYNEVGALVRNIINKRLRTMNGEGDNDLLGILLKSNLKALDQELGSKNIKLTVEDIIEECKLFYLAGQETTLALLVWTMVLLRVTMILNEVMRLYSPAAFLTRYIHKNTKLGGLVLPSGIEIMVPAIAIHHDPGIWGQDSKNFKPERFSEGIVKATKGQGTFFPFGGGPRICIGQNFALVEAKIALAMILKRFYFRLSPSYMHAPSLMFTVQPQHGAHLILQKII
ncbi:hypothetical protein RHMOL_Rhmol06G0260100 [Rhododendron molle]|uniref:Uncharacterized protein n=1 Tax=Rhododendron molle TaxID=49168 RepID=A0ACC0NIP4_RHOML|nr:hypothetical protein RHMOL_Rhmol06G0260100 [Rhododendron molle]